MNTPTQTQAQTTTAWALIGFDGRDGESVRIVGGRALYESVGFEDSTPGDQVRLSRLDVRDEGLRQVDRYVDPDTLLEIVRD